MRNNLFGMNSFVSQVHFDSIVHLSFDVLVQQPSIGLQKYPQTRLLLILVEEEL